MKTDKNFSQLPYKKPPPLVCLESPTRKLGERLTPNIKNPNERQCATSRPVSNHPQSSGVSPIHLKSRFFSCRSSPLLASTPKIKKIIKSSLKKFKKAKKELEKIKASTLQCKEKQRKKIEKYNIKTRKVNKKFKLKAFRPRTAWGSPEIKEPFIESEKNCKRKRLSNTLERRANIGLGFFHVKSSRNITPRALTPMKKEEIRKRATSKDNIKDLKDFIKKKQSEKIKQKNLMKEEWEENENKRLAQLAQVEKTAKKVLKKSLKGRLTKRSAAKTRKRFEDKTSLACSQDKEVQKILGKGHKPVISLKNGTGRECALFDNSSSQFTSNIQESEITEKNKNKRKRSDNLLGVSNSSMPIVELKSLSNTNSSSDYSENNLQQRIEAIRNRFNATNKKLFTETDQNKEIGAHKIYQILYLHFFGIFDTVRCFNPNSIDTPQLSAFIISKSQSLEKPSEKLQLEEMLSKIVKIESREATLDLEKLWAKIDLNSNPPLTLTKAPNPTCINPSPTNPSEQISESLSDHLKKITFPSIEFLSFATISEPPNENPIDSPSLSISHTSSEPTNKILIFFNPNNPQPQICPQPEPAKPYFVPKPQRPNPILIEDRSDSLSEYFGMVKETSIATPDAEEIEEFNSADFDFCKPEQKTSSNPFNTSDDTLFLDEEEVINKCVNLLLNFVFEDLVTEEIFQEYKKKHFQLLGNASMVFHELCVRTGAAAVLSFVNKIWNSIDSQALFDSLTSCNCHLKTLAGLQGRKDFPHGFISENILEIVEASSDLSSSLSISEPLSDPVRAHNRMVFDTLNELLEKKRTELNPSPWKTGEVLKNFNTEEVLQSIGQEIHKFCSIAAGRVASISMLGPDGQVDENLLLKLRESGLVSLLSIDVTEGEQLWTDYDIEECQISVDVADFILTDLLAELENFYILW